RCWSIDPHPQPGPVQNLLRLDVTGEPQSLAPIGVGLELLHQGPKALDLVRFRLDETAGSAPVLHLTVAADLVILRPAPGDEPALRLCPGTGICRSSDDHEA